jgi:hypothetical protein
MDHSKMRGQRSVESRPSPRAAARPGDPADVGSRQVHIEPDPDDPCVAARAIAQRETTGNRKRWCGRPEPGAP